MFSENDCINDHETISINSCMEIIVSKYFQNYKCNQYLCTLLSRS